MARQKRIESGGGDDVSQLALSRKLAERVDAWASDDKSQDHGRWEGVTSTTRELLKHWFPDDDDAVVRFHDCQRRALETLIYCHEVLKTPEGARVRTLRDLYEAVAPEALGEFAHVNEAADDVPFAKFCLKLATGTGKTWILQAALVWQYFNALWTHPEDEPGCPVYSQHFLVVTPGLTVLGRLLDAFLGKKDARGNRDANQADLKMDVFMPRAWRAAFRIQVLTPDDVHATSTPQEGPFVLILNWHKIVPKDPKRNMETEIFGETSDGDSALVYTNYLAAYPDLVVFNDEAHHVHNKAKKGSSKDLDARWLHAIKALHDDLREGFGDSGLFMQVDFSATPFYGAGEKKEFFPHIVYDYDLKSAMMGWSPVKKAPVGIPLVKQLFLEERQTTVGELANLDFRAIREEEDGKKRGTPVALSLGQQLMLEIGLNKLDQVAADFQAAGISKKPVLYIACEENDVADMVEGHLKSVREGALKDKILTVHSDAKHGMSEDEWDRVKFQLDTIDAPEDVNPKRIVVSVLMLREGFDVRNISVAVVLRSSESDILLEQMVGRGLRLMFPGREWFEQKRQALDDIAAQRTPSNALDFLFIVEHPRFKDFYTNLRRDGYPVISGDSSDVLTGGDLTPVPYDETRLKDYDLAWPVQFHEEGKVPDPRLISVSSLPVYPSPFAQVRADFAKITIADVYSPTSAVVATWGLRSDTLDYARFLREASAAIVREKENTILSGRRAELMGLLDDYVSTHLFGEKVDFNLEENYRVLAHLPIYDFVTRHVKLALLELLGKALYEPHPDAVWDRLSKVQKILVRGKNTVVTIKTIYPLQSPAPRGGGFEARFMRDCLERSTSVLAYSKLDPKHGFAIHYRNEFGIARDYYPDFIVRTADKMYLVETKADKDMSAPVVKRKAMAAIGWCEAASRTKPPAEAEQPQAWEYVLLSEKAFALHGRAGFDALLAACRSELQQLIAFGQGRLF